MDSHRLQRSVSADTEENLLFGKETKRKLLVTARYSDGTEGDDGRWQLAIHFRETPNDAALREKTVKEWSATYHSDIKPADIEMLQSALSSLSPLPPRDQGRRRRRRCGASTATTSTSRAWHRAPTPRPSWP